MGYSLYSILDKKVPITKYKLDQDLGGGIILKGSIRPLGHYFLEYLLRAAPYLQSLYYINDALPFWPLPQRDGLIKLSLDAIPALYIQKFEPLHPIGSRPPGSRALRSKPRFQAFLSL